MSRHGKYAPPPSPPKPSSLSDSVVVGNMKFANMVKTTNGYACAVIELTPDGKLVNMTVGRSQKFPEHVSREVVKIQTGLAQEIQRRQPPGRLM